MGSINELSDIFGELSSNNEQYELDFNYTGQIATTYHVVDKISRDVGSLIVIYNINYLSEGKMTHEAIHCCNLLCEMLGVDKGTFYGNDESFCYLVGWLVDQIIGWKNG